MRRKDYEDPREGRARWRRELFRQQPAWGLFRLGALRDAPDLGTAERAGGPFRAPGFLLLWFIVTLPLTLAIMLVILLVKFVGWLVRKAKGN
jgi:hypothetical protein